MGYMNFLFFGIACLHKKIFFARRKYEFYSCDHVSESGAKINLYNWFI